MYTPEDLNAFVKEMLNLLNKNEGDNPNGSKVAGPLGLTPAQGLVIAGLVIGLFEVSSVLINKDRVIQIVLSGSLQPGVSPT
ncbi:MAG: hypothetical protein ACOYWZ_09015 [Bacillota bacterium]